MADEKEPENEKQPGKKGLMAVLLVLVGAVLGGAGVVLMAPKPVEEKHDAPPRMVLFDHPDQMEFTVNPVVKSGLKTALIHFLFSYKADEKLVHDPHAGAAGGGAGGGAGPEEFPVPAAIGVNWNRAYSRCLEVLTNQRVETLYDPEGKQQVKRILIDELTATLFPDGEATVDDILWTKFVIQ